MSDFTQYVEHGWKLCPIQPGTKRPSGRDWNSEKNALTSPGDVEFLHGAGLLHRYSGTCALDIDDWPRAEAWLAERGVNLSELYSAPDAVRILSGRADSGKLLYALKRPMASVRITEGRDTLLEFRSATADGKSVQDVLPPSVHPETGQHYRWEYADELVGDWRTPPPLPEALQALWEDRLTGKGSAEAESAPPARSAGVQELQDLLRNFDPSASRDEWIRVGAALHYETGGSPEGMALWDEWSRRSDKYQGLGDIETNWRSFRSDRADSITAGFLRRGAIATPDEFEDCTQAPDGPDPWADLEREKLRRYEPVHVADVANRPPPTWLVDKLLPEGEIAMIYGPSGVGKSFVALDLAFCVALGEQWMDRTVRQGPVVWIAAEAAGSMRNRAKAYAQANGLHLDLAELWMIGDTPSLMDQDEAAILTQAVSSKHPRMIVVDTLAAASGGANENSGEDMNLVMESCRRMHKATGALILLIHHTGKDETRGARGWSGLKAAMQTEIFVHEIGGVKAIEVTKQRDAEAGDPWPFRLETVALDMDGETSCVVDIRTPQEMGIRVDPDRKLGRVQQGIYEAICAKVNFPDEPVLAEEIYEDAIKLLPPGPPDQKRDRRPEKVRRALETLMERELIRVEGDLIYVIEQEK
jgi:hypothetical protein